MKPKVLLIGATGLFGERLARRLAGWRDIDLVLAGRHVETVRSLAEKLGARWSVLDRSQPDSAALAVFCVIDCAGPFQGAGYGLAQAALAAGAHYIDIADGRDFVAGFEEDVDKAAHSAGRSAITGASSTPALSHAALDHLARGWRQIDEIIVGISPSGQTRPGLSVMRAILSWVGHPVRVFSGGAWKRLPGWSGPRLVAMPGLGHRWLSLAETPDLDLLVERYHPVREALFMAGLESWTLHLGLWNLSFVVRLGLIASLAPFAKAMRVAAGLFAPAATFDGGMIAEVRGLGAKGEPAIARWALLAEQLEGPHVPTLAASATLRALLAGRVPTGARVCAGLLTLDEIMAQIGRLPITTCVDGRYPDETGLFRRLIGPAFDAIPEPVRRVHSGRTAQVFHGVAVARGSGGLARLARAFAGVKLGRFGDFSVEIRPTGRGERWTRHFGHRAFASTITDNPRALGRFTERLGPLSFDLEAWPDVRGFDWIPRGWRLGPVPLPKFMAPKIRARTYAAGGIYRFTVLVSHPLAGVIVAYAGRLSL